MSTVLLAGDINLLNVDDPAVPLHRLSGVLADADAVFSNLECMLGVSHSHSVEQEGFFADPAIAAKVLQDANVTAVGIANNINYGAAPIMASIGVLDDHGIAHAGAGEDILAARRPAVVERGGVRYGFLQRTSVYWPTDHAADDHAPGVAPLMGHTAYEAPMYRYSKWLFPANRPGIPPQIVTWADKEHLDGLRSDIEALRAEVDVVVASFHWGLGQHVLAYMEDIAHAAVDAGADIVMGHGPHEPLAVELRNGKPIFYGLGSFSFHTGHLGIAHGDWVGLLASVDPHAPEPTITLRFVRHNSANETYLSPASDEKKTIDALGLHSLAYGTSLAVEGDIVRVTQG